MTIIRIPRRNGRADGFVQLQINGRLSRVPVGVDYDASAPEIAALVDAGIPTTSPTVPIDMILIPASLYGSRIPISVNGVVTYLPTGTAISAIAAQTALLDAKGIAYISGTSTPTPVVTPTPTVVQSSLTDTGPTGNSITATSPAGPVPMGRYAAGDPFAIASAVTFSPTATTLLSGVATFAAEAVTFTDSTNAVGQAGHGLIANDQVSFDTITTTTGIATNTKYYVLTVLTTSSFTIAATPGGAVIDLVSNGTGMMRRFYMQDRDTNGAMVNPKPQLANGSPAGTGANPSITFQGLDTFIYSKNSKPTEFPYAATLNAEKAGGGTIAGNNIAVAKVRSVITNLDRGGRDRVSDLMIFSLLDTIPPAGSFRRGTGSTDKTPLFTTADIDWSGYPSFTPPVGPALPTKASILALLGPINNFIGTQDLFSRGTRPFATQSQYGGDFARDLVQAVMFTMTSTTSVADRNEVMNKVLQMSCDVLEQLEVGFRYSGATFSFGGAHQWVKLLMVIGTYMFRNAANIAARNNMAKYVSASDFRIFADDMMIVPVTRALIETVPPTDTLPRISPTGFRHHDENAFELMTKPSGNYVSYSFETAYRQTNSFPLMGTALFARLLGLETAWNNPAFFQYIDRFFNWWTRRGFPETESRVTPFIAGFLKAQWTAASPRYQSGAALSVTRRVARDQYVWFECNDIIDNPLFANRPAPSDFTVTIDGAPVALATIAVSGCSATATNAATATNVQFPTIAVPGAQAAGVRVGMAVGHASIPHECTVTGVNGSVVTVSTYVPALSNQTITFSPVFVGTNAFGVVLPTDPTSFTQVVQSSYIPGANPIRNLRGTAIAAQALATVTNNTGRLPDAFVGTPAVVYGGADKETRQFMGMEQPKAAGTLKRLMWSEECVIPTALATNEQWLVSSSPSTLTFRFYAASATEFRLTFGSDNTGSVVAQQLRISGSITDLFAAIPPGTKMVLHFLIDLTATTYDTMFRAVFKGANGGTYVLGSGVGRWGTTTILTDGSLTISIERLFAQGLFRGASRAGTDAGNIGFGKFLLAYGGASLPIPANFDGPQFAYNAAWGDNAGNVWGFVPQFYFPFSVEDANSKATNRGMNGSAALTPRRLLDEETGELISLFEAI